MVGTWVPVVPWGGEAQGPGLLGSKGDSGRHTQVFPHWATVSPESPS